MSLSSPPSSAAAATNAATARLLLVAVCIGWGTTWPSMRIALEEIPPFSMRTASLALGSGLLIALALFQRRSLALPTLRTWLHVAVASSFNVVAFSLFTPFAQLAAETSRVTIMVYTMPIWAMLFAVPILGERLTAHRVAGFALCIAGMTVLVAPLSGDGIPVGILLALGAAIGWAAGTVYLKWAKPEGDPLAITIWQLLIGLAVITGCLLIVEGWPNWNVSGSALTALIYSGLIGSGLSYFLWFETVRRLPALTASLGVLASPVVGVVAAMIMLGERPTIADTIGFALMLAASACVLMRPGDAPRPP